MSYIALGFAASGFLLNAVADVSYEKPPVFQAARILPAKLLKSPYHSVGSKVVNDGQMNHYTIKSKFGTVKADSSAELKIRVDEMRALAAMERVSYSNQLKTRSVFRLPNETTRLNSTSTLTRRTRCCKNAWKKFPGMVTAGRLQQALFRQFVKFAVLARNGNIAFFRAHQAEMYANLNKVTTVERFVAVGANAAAPCQWYSDFLLAIGLSGLGGR